MVWKPEKWRDMFGAMDWAEANLHGGTIQFFKLLGILFSIIGLLAMTGLFTGLLLWILTPLFGSLA